MMRPELRPDFVTPQKVYSRHCNGLEPFGGLYLVYVDVAYGSVRSALDTLNRVVPNLGVEGARANPTPIRSFATSPVERRVTLIIEFPRGPSNIWEVLENLWVELYRAAEWEMKRFVIGPVALYSAATHYTSVVIQSDSLHYTSSRTIWATVIAGVPLGQRKVLWKLDPNTTMEDLSFAADEYNSTADERDRIKEILGYSEEEDRMISRWRMERAEREMRILPATDEQWYDVRIRIQGYTYGDYNDFVSHFFTSACRQLSTAGWIPGESPVLHASTGPAHAQSHREWARVTFPDEVVARAFYYMAQNNRAEARHQTFNVEVWNPSFNAELNEPNRCNMLARWRATRAISEFTPQIAVGFFPAGTPLATLIDINEILRGGERREQLALDEGLASLTAEATEGLIDVVMHPTTQ